MTTEQLANYLINNEYEMEIVRRDYIQIAYYLRDEGIECDRQRLADAVELARQDPYILQMIERFAQ